MKTILLFLYLPVIMTLTFYKYQGTGNDFIIVDNRLQSIDKTNSKRIAELCNRRFGIGADGFIFLENDDNSDFKMVYYNADGNESSMCGNGGRCITAFAKFLGIINNEAEFRAIDGLHSAKITASTVALKMQNVEKIDVFENHIFLDTGSPHHIKMVPDLVNYEVKANGSKIRYGKLYNNAGSNINFVEQLDENRFAIRTYERGVEDETLSCGTGATAVAIAMHKSKKTKSKEVLLETLGGKLKITFNKTKNNYTNIWLIGSAKQIYKGKIEW